MIRWLAGRVAQGVITLLVAAALIFILMRAAPGDPLAQLVGERSARPAEIAALRARLKLDRPLPEQLAAYAASVARGDLGTSIAYGRPVTQLIGERLPASLLLGGSVLLLNFTLGLWLGVQQAVRRDSPTDHMLSALSLAGYSMPSFWLGLLLAWLVAIEWRLLPAAGMRDPLLVGAATAERTVDILRHLVLPAVTLSVVSIAATMRYQRAAMIEALSRPFVQTARSKGLRHRTVMWRHAWRNALFPVLTLFGLWLPVLVTGSVFVESVFAWPGLGLLAAQAAGARDYPVLMGTALLVTGMVVVGALLTDVAYAALDPRVRRA